MPTHQSHKPQLQRAMVFILLANLLCAFLVAGVIASWWFARYDRDNNQQKHQLQLALAAEGLGAELRSLSQSLAQLALDSDVLFAPSAALFASPAVDKLDQLLLGYAAGSRGYITDAKGQLIEAVAEELQPELPAEVAEFIPQLLAQKNKPTGGINMVLPFNQQPALALVQPLILRSLADAPIQPGVGALVLLLDSQWLAARSQDHLGNYQLLALTLGDQHLQLGAEPANDEFQLSHSLMLAGDIPLTLNVVLGDELKSQQICCAHFHLWLLLLLGLMLLAPLMLWLGLKPTRDLLRFVNFCASYRHGTFKLPQPPVRWQEQQQLWAVFQQLTQPQEPKGAVDAAKKTQAEAAADNADTKR